MWSSAFLLEKRMVHFWQGGCALKGAFRLGRVCTELRARSGRHAQPATSSEPVLVVRRVTDGPLFTGQVGYQGRALTSCAYKSPDILVNMQILTH